MNLTLKRVTKITLLEGYKMFYNMNRFGKVLSRFEKVQFKGGLSDKKCSCTYLKESPDRRVISAADKGLNV